MYGWKKDTGVNEWNSPLSSLYFTGKEQLSPLQEPPLPRNSLVWPLSVFSSSGKRHRLSLHTVEINIIRANRNRGQL
jgi:hypothetical protein